MSKKILILAGSPRKHGNSDHLADAFINGAEKAGHDVEKVYIKDLKISGCLGCMACQKNGGKCVQKDDMSSIYEKVMAADVLVLAFPVYFYSWNSQLKAVLDRFCAIEKLLTNTTFYILVSCAAPSMEFEQPVLDSFRNYLSCFRAGGNTEGGFVFAFGTVNLNDAKDNEAVNQAFSMGENV